MSPSPSPDRQSFDKRIQDAQGNIDGLDGKLDSTIDIAGLPQEQKDAMKQAYIDKVNAVQGRVRRSFEKINVQRDLHADGWRKWEDDVLEVEKDLSILLSDEYEKLRSKDEVNIAIVGLADFNLKIDELLGEISALDEKYEEPEQSAENTKQGFLILFDDIFRASPESGAQAVEAYSEEYLKHSHSMNLADAVSHLRDIEDLQRSIGKPLTVFGRNSLAGLIAHGEELELYRIKEAVMQQHSAKLLPIIEEIVERLPVLESQIAREKEFITDMTKQDESLFAWATGVRTNRDALIAQKSASISDLITEADSLKTREKDITQQLEYYQTQLALLRHTIERHDDPDNADHLLLRRALSLSPIAREDSRLKTALEDALDRMDSLGTLEGTFTQTEIERLRGYEDDAVEHAIDAYRQTLETTQIVTQLEQAEKTGGTPFTIELCDAATQVPGEYLEKANQSDHIHIAAKGWGVQEMRTIRFGDGQEIPGIVMSKEAQEKLQNAPQGYMPILLRVPPPHRPVSTPKERSWNARRISTKRWERYTEYTFTFEQNSRSRLKPEDIAFAKTIIGAGREIAVQKLDDAVTIHDADITEAAGNGVGLQAALLEHPAVHTLEKGGREMLSAFGSLQQMLQAGMEGHKEAGFVETTRGHAADLLNAYRKSGIEHRLTEVWDLVTELDSLPKSAIDDEMSQWIDALKQQLDALTIMVRSGAVEELCEQVVSDAFDTDGFWKWMRTHGVIMASTIGVAVLAALTIPTGGATGVAAIALTSAYSATGAYIGTEVGKGMVSVYDDGIRSDLQKLMNDEMEVTQYLGSMTQQIGTGFVTSFVLIGAGSYVGNAARSVAAQGTAKFGPKEVMARVVTRTAKELGRIDEALEKLPLGRNQMARFARETMQEFYEEGGEGSFEWMATSADQAGDVMAARVLKGCAFIFSMLNCAKGPGLTLGSSTGITMDAMQKIGDNRAYLQFSYNESLSDLKTNLAASGITNTTAAENGVLRVTGEKDGITVVREYTPTTEPEFMRNIRGQSTRKDGTNALEAYGVRFDGDGHYSMQIKDPKGQLSLEQYLRAQGAIVQQHPDGTLQVRHGEEVVTVSLQQVEAVASEAKQTQVTEQNIENESQIDPQEKQPYEMTRKEFGEYIVFHGTSSRNADGIRKSIIHPKIQEDPQYQGKEYAGRVVSNGELHTGADFTYNAITAAVYGNAKEKIANRQRNNGGRDIGVIVYTRRTDVGLPPKGTYQDASEATLTEGNPDTKAKTGGVLGYIPASIFDGLDQLNPEHMEIAFDRAYQYILDQRQRELVMQRDIDEKTGVTDSSAQSVEQGTPKAVHEANNAEGISKEISDLAEKSEKHTRAEAYVNSPDVLIQLEAIFNGTDIPPAVQTKLIEHMKKYALQQQIDNPEQYVSHGFDHTLRVKAKMEMVMEMNPKIVDAIMQKYNLPPEKARMLAQVLAVYHDFGYAYVPNGPDRKPLRKALHAVTGAEIASDPELQSILRECFDSSANMNEILFDLKNGVLFHSADKVEVYRDTKIKISHGIFIIDSSNVIDVYSMYKRDNQQGSIEISTTAENIAAIKVALQEKSIPLDSFTFIQNDDSNFAGRPVDLKEKGDNLLGLEFKKVDSLQEPLEFLIRFADNLDIAPDRFSEIQGTQAFRDVYHRFGQATETGRLLEKLEEIASTINKTGMTPEANQKLESILNADSSEKICAELGLDPKISSAESLRVFIDTYKKSIAELVISNPQYSEEVANIGKEDILRIAELQDSVSFRHFGGCEAIDRITLRGRTLEISVNSKLFNELNKTVVTERTVTDTGKKNSVKVGVGEYQIWRTYEAHRSLMNDGESIIIQVVDQEGSILIDDFAAYFESHLQ